MIIVCVDTCFWNLPDQNLKSIFVVPKAIIFI